MVFGQTFGSVVNSVLGIINSVLIPFVISLSVLVLLYGIFRYAGSGSDEKKLKEGLNYIFYGIIIISISLSVFGLITLIKNSFFPENVGNASFTISPKLSPK